LVERFNKLTLYYLGLIFLQEKIYGNKQINKRITETKTNHNKPTKILILTKNNDKRMPLQMLQLLFWPGFTWKTETGK